MKHGKREWRLMCICWLHNSQFIRNIAFEADPNTLINRDVYNWKLSMNFTMASDWTFEYVQHHLRNLRVSYHLIISVFKRIIEAWCFEPFLLGLMFCFFFSVSGRKKRNEYAYVDMVCPCWGTAIWWEQYLK